MDTSIAKTPDPVLFITNGHVLTRNIGPDEWARIIKAGVSHLRPSKMLLPYVREHTKAHEKATEMTGGHQFLGRIPDSIVYASEGEALSRSTRLLPIGQFGVRSMDAVPPADIYQSKKLEEHYLFLTDSFAWVRLTRIVTRRPEVRVDLLFDLISEQDLVAFIGERQHWWLEILRSLKLLASKVANEKREQVEVLEAAAKRIDGMLSRMAHC